MRRRRSNIHPAAGEPRASRRIHREGSGRATFRRRGKLEDPTGCPRCGACYRNGRWTWRRAPARAARALCTACERIEVDYPDGYVDVRGSFAGSRREEILQLARHVEERERREHPLKRLMPIREIDGGFRIPVTDRKLARAIGRSLERAYRGKLEQPRVDDESLLRVGWRRD